MFLDKCQILLLQGLSAHREVRVPDKLLLVDDGRGASECPYS